MKGSLSAEGLIAVAFVVSVGGGLLLVSIRDGNTPTGIVFAILGGSVEGAGLMLAYMAGRCAGLDDKIEEELEGLEDDEA